MADAEVDVDRLLEQLCDLRWPRDPRLPPGTRD